MPTPYTDRIVGRLRNQGMKITPQRIAILKVLEGNKKHPSVEEIHREVSKTFPTLSLATVYNTMDTLEKIAEVQPLWIDPARKRYEPSAVAHHHIVCRRCGTIRDVFADFLPALSLPGDISRDFRLESTSISFRGVCRDCSGTTS